MKFIVTATDAAGEPLASSTTITVASAARGPQGADGADGPAGADGAPGVGVAPGGTADQVLTKVDATDYNTEWRDVAAVAAPDAGDIDFTPAGTIAATDVQAALEELDADSRMSNARTPTAHATSHQDGGADELALDASQVTTGTLDDARIPSGITRDVEAAAAYQPLDSDLTAIAALTTTTFGRALLALADAAAGRTALGLGTAATSASTDFQPVDSDLTSIAALTTTSFGRSLLEAANASALRTLAGLVLGTDIYSKAAVDSGFQPLDADLTAIAALTTTSYGRALLAVSNLAALQAILGTTGTPSSSTYLRGDGSWSTPSGGAAFAGCKVYRSAAYSLAASADTAFPWDAEDYDTDGFHDNSTNPSRMTVPTGMGGKYRATGCIRSSVGYVTARFLVQVRVNGNTVHGGVDERYSNSASNFPAGSVTVDLNLSAGDYVEIWYNQATGATKAIEVTECGASLTKIG